MLGKPTLISARGILSSRMVQKLKIVVEIITIYTVVFPCELLKLRCRKSSLTTAKGNALIIRLINSGII